MRKINQTKLKGLALSASVLAIAVGGSAFAQETKADCAANEELIEGECVIQTPGPDGVNNTVNDAEDVVDVTGTGATGDNAEGAIIVTGSRIRRPDAYSSISPLQVITKDSQNDAGIFDPTQILQRDEAATGTQIDATFQGFVLDNGPGNQTVNLRGLGADRTLLMLNGRRLAPSGVGGSPTAPSTNLLPSSLIDRVDLLLDGASSVYGSDAVAGVINVILKRDFDGLELAGSGTYNPEGAGDDYNISASWGKNFDRGFFGIGAEYDFRERVRARDRDFLAGCTTDYEITDTGEIRTVEVLDRVNTEVASGGLVTLPDNECQRTGQGLRGSIQEFGYFGVLYFTPGRSNSGVPNYTESGDFFGNPVDTDGDGVQDFRFADVSTNGAYPNLELVPQQERYNVMALGEYELGGDANITPFFEALYSRAEIESRVNNIIGNSINVPATNQFNPCNPYQPNGVDCFNLGAQFNFGVNAVPFPVDQPVRSRFVLAGDRDNFDTTVEQYRGVLGVRGDLPFLSPSWTFEVSGAYTKSIGKSSAIGLREDKLAFALGIDPTADYNGDGIVDNDGDGIADDFDSSAQFGSLFGFPDAGDPCDVSILSNPELASPDLLDGCVAVDLFTPGLIGPATGDLATLAERDYLLGQRTFDTTYEQTLFSAFATGDLFELPAGPVGAVVGLEWRKDKIESTTNFVTGNGLFYNFNADRGANGSKWIREAYAELDVPLEADKPWVRDLRVNLAARVTDEELYGTAATYSIKAGWRPIDPLLLRFSYGTSFRAPNLRENFLTGTTGFQGVTDPCAVPTAAFVGGVYRADLDTRDPQVLQACRDFTYTNAAGEVVGRDPTTVGIDLTGRVPRVSQATSIEITRQGSLDLDPETSRSITAGFSFEESFGGWDLAFSSSYYDIKVKDSVVELSAPFAVSDCFERDDGQRSQFCDQIFVGTAPGDFGLLTRADIGFLNLDEDSVRGADFNASVGKEVSLGGEDVEFNLDLRANRLIERSRTFIDLNGARTFSDFTGEFGLPKWAGRGTFSAQVDRLTFTWQTRWVGEQNQDPDGVDELSDAFGYGPDGERTGFIGSTCTGGGSRDAAGNPDGVVEGDGVYCRDIGYTEDWFEHAASIRYNGDDFILRFGVSNIFDTAPPRVDCGEVGLCISNIPIGGSFNLDGREFFASAEFKF